MARSGQLFSPTKSYTSAHHLYQLDLYDQEQGGNALDLDRLATGRPQRPVSEISSRVDQLSSPVDLLNSRVDQLNQTMVHGFVAMFGVMLTGFLTLAALIATQL